MGWFDKLFDRMLGIRYEGDQKMSVRDQIEKEKEERRDKEFAKNLKDFKKLYEYNDKHGNH